MGNWKSWAFEKVLLTEIQIFMWNFPLFKKIVTNLYCNKLKPGVSPLVQTLQEGHV